MILFFILVFIILLLFLSVKFKIEFRFIGNKIFFKISSSYLFGIFSPEIYPFDRGHKKLESSKLIAFRRIIRELDYLDLSKYIWRRIDIERLKIDLKINSNNPFITSILYGLLWTVNGIVFNCLLIHKDIKDLEIDILPLFEENHLDIRFDCIIKIKMVYIINIWIRLIKLYKGGENGVRTPNRRINEVHNE